MGSEMTPEQAAASLADLPDYEETVTARTVGLSMMLWALVLPGEMFLIHLFEGRVHQLPTTAFLWAAFPLGALFMTHLLWRSRAADIDAAHSIRRFWAFGLASLFGVFALFVLVGDNLVGPFGLDGAIATGVLLMVFGALQARAAWCRVPWALIGGAAAVVAVLLVLGQDLPHGFSEEATAAGAIITFLALFVPGALTYQQG